LTHHHRQGYLADIPEGRCCTVVSYFAHVSGTIDLKPKRVKRFSGKRPQLIGLFESCRDKKYHVGLWD
jgi:hypothetical protein